MNHQSAIFLTALLLIAGMSGAQPRRAMGGPPGAAERGVLYYDALSLPGDNDERSRVDVLYRIDQEFLIPVKKNDPAFAFAFRREGELLIELLDSTGVSKARDIRRFDIGAQTEEEHLETKQWFEGIATFSVLPGTYTIVIELDDVQSNRKFLDRKRTILAKRYAGTSCQVSSPMIVMWPPAEGTLIPQNFDGNLLFGSTAAVYCEMAGTAVTMDSVRVQYTLNQFSPGTEKTLTFADSMISVVPTATTIVADQSQEGRAHYSIRTSTRANHNAFLVPLPSAAFPLRRFTLALKVHQATTTVSVDHPLAVLWPDMPLSLRDVDYAIDALRYITTEQTRDSLQQGSFEERRDHLEQFWKARDKTPATAYNEVMTEYYTRVDYAARMFSTLREPDGSRTDRAKVYILYGPPSKTDRTLDPDGGFKEVWLYENLHKEFLFADQGKSGNYVLISSRSI